MAAEVGGMSDERLCAICGHRLHVGRCEARPVGLYCPCLVGEQEVDEIAVEAAPSSTHELCARCGHPEFAPDGSPIHIDEREPDGDDSDDFCRECVREGRASVHPFEAAPSTDEGEARWWVGEWCAKHNGHHLQHGEDGSRMVVADYDSGEMVCQLLNEAVAIRAPLEERLLVAETLVAVRTRKLDEAEARAARSHELRRAAEARELRARDAAAILGRSRWQARKDLRAAEERIRELEAVAFHTDGIMHIATERIETLEGEVERLREALNHVVTYGQLGHADYMMVKRALATSLSSTEGTDTLKANFDGCPFCGGDESIGVHTAGRCEGTKEVEG